MRSCNMFEKKTECQEKIFKKVIITFEKICDVWHEWAAVLLLCMLCMNYEISKVQSVNLNNCEHAS